MDRVSLENLLLTPLLIIIQILICNHICLFGVAVPFIFIYVIVSLPLSMRTSTLLTWAFLSGLIVDIFSDTLGINALACTILAILKRPMLFAYIPKDDRTRDIAPSISSLGFADYCKYVLSMSVIYCAVIFIIEYFNYAHVKDIAVMTISSAIFTFALLLGINSLSVTKKK